jgi:alkanesulfonate monooxygenase SsuD/methylene tetrahydromethanopterin reductase-like flavin-dependent oxidoreductase (luciferase family)
MTMRAEQLGIDFVAVLDHLIDFWEQWSLLSALAARTTTIGLESYVTCTAYRNPALLAKIATTVDEISGGRLTLGIGAGDSDTEHRMFGFERQSPVARFEEALSIVSELLKTGRISHDGKYYRLRDCEIRPRGPRESRPPILVGSLGGERMLRAAARHADIVSYGTLLRTNSPGELDPFTQQIDAACVAEGRQPQTLQRMAEVLIEFEGGNAAAWTDLKPVSGTPATIAATLRAFAEAGYPLLNIWIEPNSLSGIEKLGEVLAILRDQG